jgi:hypothetical protein
VLPASASWRNLAKRDFEFIESQNLSECNKLFFIYDMTFIKNFMRDSIIAMSSRQIKAFRGANSKNYRRKLYLLLELGIIAPYKIYRKIERKAEEYRVLYDFQDNNEKYRQYKTTGERIIELYLSGLTYQEIRIELPNVPRQQIAYHCKKLAQLEQLHQYGENEDIDYELLESSMEESSPFTAREIPKGRLAEACHKPGPEL